MKSLKLKSISRNLGLS